MEPQDGLSGLIRKRDRTSRALSFCTHAPRKAVCEHGKLEGGLLARPPPPNRCPDSSFQPPGLPGISVCSLKNLKSFLFRSLFVTAAPTRCACQRSRMLSFWGAPVCNVPPPFLRFHLAIQSWTPPPTENACPHLLPCFKDSGSTVSREECCWHGFGVDTSQVAGALSIPGWLLGKKDSRGRTTRCNAWTLLALGSNKPNVKRQSLRPWRKCDDGLGIRGR